MTNNRIAATESASVTQKVQQEDPPYSWLALALICVVAALGFAHRFMLSIFVDPISQEIGLNDVQFGILQGTSYALAYAIASIAVGHWVDSAGRIRLLMLSSITWISGSILFAVAPSYSVLIVARIVLGVGETVLLPAGVSLIWDLFGPRRRGIAMGCFSGATALGVSLSSAVPGSVFDMITRSGLVILGLTPWRLTYVLVSAVSLLLIIPLLLLREPERTEQQQNAAFIKTGMFGLLAHRNILIPLYTGGMFITFAEATLLSWIPTILIRDFALARSAFSPWYGLIVFLSSVVGALVGGFLADASARSGGAHRRMLPALGASMIVCPLLLLLDTRDLDRFAFCFAISSTLLVAGSVSIMTALAALLPNELRGKATGLYAFINVAVGLGLGQMLVPVVARELGSGGSFAPAILATLIPGLALGFLALALGYHRANSLSQAKAHVA